MTSSTKALAVALACATALVAVPAVAQKVKVAVPSFLTGAGAPAFGIPGKNGAELIIRGIIWGIYNSYRPLYPFLGKIYALR